MTKKLALIGFAALIFAPGILKADEGTTMKDIMLDMSAYVTYLEDSLSQEIVHLHADIIGEDGVTYTRTLYKGWTYGVTAFGDWRVKDLDIIIYKDVDGEWIEIKRDEEEDNQPTIIIEPSATGNYMVELLVYKFNEEYSVAHYGLVIFHELTEE